MIFRVSNLVTCVTNPASSAVQSRADSPVPPGIGVAIWVGVWTNEERLEHYCRMGLLGVAILHWIVFALMITSADGSISDQAPRAFSNLASALLQQLTVI